MKAIYQWVLRTMMKGQTGVMKTLPKKDLIDFNVAMTAERLARNGFNANAFKNANQVENAIKQIEAPRNVQQGITKTKSADVFDLKGKKINPDKGIIGGKQFDDLPPGDDDLPPPGSRGGDDDIAAPFQSAEDTIKNMIEAENKKNIAKMKNRKTVKDAIDNVSPGFVKGDRKYNAQLVAEDLAEKRFGKNFYDLDQKQQMDLYDEALDGLSVDLDEFAQGGRAGFANGSKGLLDILNIQAEGSKSGKQQIDKAPEGFTIDNETYNLIINADIPISKKINLLTTYGRDKGRTRIEKDGQELLLGEGGSRKREIGLDFNPKAEKGFSGKIMYDPDDNNVRGGITYKFAGGGRAGFSQGLGFKFLKFLNENNPVQAYKKYLQSVKTRAQENPKALGPELAAITAGGIFVNRRMQDILKNMKEKDMENNLENFRKELNKDPFYQKYPKLKDKTIEAYTEKMFGEKKADGGRIGLKDGMDRRTFMKIMAGITALPVLGKFFKGAKVASKAAPIIKTPNAPGKPEWFDALVTKVVNEGTDVTKGFATKERELVHTKQINDFAEVTVYRDLDTNTTIVNYGSALRKDPTKPYEKGNISRAVNDPDQIDLVVKGAEDVEPTIIENEKGFVRRRGTKSSAEFEAYESEPRVVNYDGDMEFDGTNVVNNVDDLNEDVSVLKEYATGEKLTPEEAAKAKKKREDYQKFLEDPVEQANYLENKYGPGPEPDDFASGGIARMLGE